MIAGNSNGDVDNRDRMSSSKGCEKKVESVLVLL